MLAAPVFPPWQLTLVCEVSVALSEAAGWVITTDCTTVHPFASTTVQFQVPAVRLFAVGLAWAGVVFQAYE